MRDVRPITTSDPFDEHGPVKTIGWDVVNWIEDNLIQPDGDDAGEPFRLTREQLHFVLWFYAVDPNGRFVYRRAVLRRPKGWGKSPLLGAICLAELCGPVRFGGFDAGGEAVGIPHSAPWISLAGVSETQTMNTLTVILAMCENAPIMERYGLDLGITRIYYPAMHGRLIPITASSASQEGARPSFVVLDESHQWMETNGGWKLARVIRRNLAKSRDGSARSIETTNAHAPGAGSVAEGSYLAYRAIVENRSRASGLLYDCREAPGWIDLADPELLLAGLRVAYGDSTWVDLERVRDEVYDPDTPPEDARRFYLNQLCAAADSWIAPHQWDANERQDLPPLRRSEPGDWRTGADTVTLGFDGSLTDDSTGLVAVRMSDGAPFLIGLWEKPAGAAGNGWEVNKDDVRGTVAHAFATLDVVAFHADVHLWETDVDQWADDHRERLVIKAVTRHAVGYDMRGHQAEITRAVETLNRAIVDQECPHDGDLRLRRHVLNARRRPNKYGITFGKEHRESPHKVDALACMVLARLARSRVIAERALGKRGAPGRLVGFGGNSQDVPTDPYADMFAGPSLSLTPREGDGWLTFQPSPDS